MSDDLIERLRAQVPYQGKSAIAFLCHEAADALAAKEAENARLKALLDQEISSVRQATSATGELIRVGGEGEFDQILLRDHSGEIIAGCFATKDVAKKLAKCLHEHVRLHGIASWHRDRHGKWQISRMKVQTFETLETDSLSDALDEVQSAVSEWPDDLTDTLLAMRRGEAA